MKILKKITGKLYPPKKSQWRFLVAKFLGMTSTPNEGGHVAFAFHAPPPSVRGRVAGPGPSVVQTTTRPHPYDGAS